MRTNGAMLSGMGWTAIRFVAVTALGFALNLAGQAFGLSQQQAQIAVGVSVAIFVIYVLGEIVWRLPKKLNRTWAAYQSRGPVKLDFTVNSPFGFTRSKGGRNSPDLAEGEISPLWISSFYFKARNRSGERIKIHSAVIQSDIKPETLQLEMSGNDTPSGYAPPSGNVVMPGAEFVLVGRIPSTDPRKTEGMSASALSARFGAFRLIVDCDGKELVWKFPAKKVEALIARGERTTRDSMNRARAT